VPVAAPSPEPAERLNIVSPAPAPRYRMVAAFALYYLIPMWIAWFVYDFSTDGLVSEIGEATGALAIPALIATVVRLRSKRKSNVPFYVAVGFAAFGIISGNQYRIKEAIDANAYKREMAGATPENYRDKLAHSQTRLGQTLYSAIQISENSAAKFREILSTLDDNDTGNILTTETLLNREKRSRAKQMVKQKMEFARVAFSQIETLYSDMRKDVDAKLADVPDNFKRSFLAGFDESLPENEKLIKAYVADYADLYKHLLAMLDILDANDGRFTIRQDGKVIFADNAPIAPYNQETADLQRDAANLQQIQARMVTVQSAGIKKLIPEQ
jgi:hypothetical protein